LVVLSSGCGAPLAVSCDYRSNPGARPICNEWSGVPAAQHDGLKSICSSPSVWAESGCPRAGVLGGCEQTAQGVTATMWFYADAAHGIATAPDVMAQCSTNMQTFVAP
jgi:hypothetical protein